MQSSLNIESLRAAQVEINVLNDNIAHESAAAEAAKAVEASHSLVTTQLLGERYRRIRDSTDLLYALADEGTLQGDDLINSVESLVMSFNSEPHVKQLQDAKDFAKTLRPGSLLCHIDDRGLISLGHLAEGEGIEPPKPVLIDRSMDPGWSLPTIRIGYFVTIEDGLDGTNSRIISSRNFTVGEEAVLAQLRSMLKQDIHTNRGGIERADSLINAFKALGKEDEVANYRATATADARNMFFTHISNGDYHSETIALAKYLYAHSRETLQSIYDEMATHMTRRTITDTILSFVNMYLSATNDKYRSLPPDERNHAVIAALRELLSRGQEITCQSPANN